MNKAIVTTTINPPTKAILKFLEIAKRDDWKIFVVADKKTPADDWQKLIWKSDINARTIVYIAPDHQEAISKELSDLIGWNCIQRRNFGLIAAYQAGAEIIATVDDDNIPLPNWGKNLAVGKEVTIDQYSYKPDVPADYIVFDPLSATTQSPNIWHRGFPIQLLKLRNRLNKTEGVKRRVLVQADLWNGDPDIDAICRIAKNPIVKFESVQGLYASDKPGPFNSQNTFLHRDLIPDYFLFPHIGRMDDIFASYYVQAKHPESVVYGPASVFQERNPHDLLKDLEAEMLGYRYALDFTQRLEVARQDGNFRWPEYIPGRSLAAFNTYRTVLGASK